MPDPELRAQIIASFIMLGVLVNIAISIVNSDGLL